MNARQEQIHQGVAMTMNVSARQNRRSLSTSLLSTIHFSSASRVRCFSMNSSAGTRTQPGCQLCRSRWISGRPVFVDSARENVLLPAPAIPVTTMRLPIVEGVSISLMALRNQLLIRLTIEKIPKEVERRLVGVKRRARNDDNIDFKRHPPDYCLYRM